MNSGDLRLVAANTVAAHRVRYLHAMTVPLGAVTLLVGRGGWGKSTIACEWAARATRGDLPGDLYGTPAAVVIVSVEDHRPSVLHPRLDAAGADLGRVYFVDVVRDGFATDPVLPDDLDQLDATLTDLAEPVGLVILDPPVAVLGEQVNSHRQQDVRRVLAHLTRVAEHHDLAVLGIMHLNKDSMLGDALDRISGSNGFGNGARSVLAVGPHPEDDNLRVLAHAKSNTGPLQPGRVYRIESRTIESSDGPIVTSGVVWAGTTDVHADDLLSEANRAERSRVAVAAEWLEDFLAEGPVPAKTVKEAAERQGIAFSTLKRAKTRLGVPSDKTGGQSGQPWLWSLPEAEQDQPANPLPLDSLSPLDSLPLEGDQEDQEDQRERVRGHAPLADKTTHNDGRVGAASVASVVGSNDAREVEALAVLDEERA